MNSTHRVPNINCSTMLGKKFKSSKGNEIKGRLKQYNHLDSIDPKTNITNGKKKNSDLNAPDTSVFYRKAVTNLKYFLTESYKRQPKESFNGNTEKFDRKKEIEKTLTEVPNVNTVVSTSPEMMIFIQRQESYIQHLENESHFCQDETSKMISKMKEIIFENESLRRKVRYLPEGKLLPILSTCEPDHDTESDYNDDDYNNLNNNFKITAYSPKVIDMDPNRIINYSGSTILYESRISELEAHLTKTKIQLKKIQNELETAKQKEKEKCNQSENIYNMNGDQQKKIETLQRENDEMHGIISQLQATINNLRDKEIVGTQKLRQAYDNIEQIRFEKSLAEREVNRLSGELEKLQIKHRESLQEQCHIRQEAERQYSKQIEKLLTDLQVQWDNNGQLTLEVDKQKRVELEIRRELAQKNNHIDEMKTGFNNETNKLQNEVLSINAHKESLEHQLMNIKMQLERADRHAKLDSKRFQDEITCLCQRLDRTDTELLHSRKENIRLREQISALEKELHLVTLSKETSHNQHAKSEQGITSMILDMDTKHGKHIADLENMIQSQTQLIECLKEECNILTQKLDDAGARHKEEMVGLQNNLEYLSNKISYDAITEETGWNDNTDYTINQENEKE